VILKCAFNQNNNILSQQHWPLGLQIGLPSWYVFFYVLGPSQDHKVGDFIFCYFFQPWLLI
jgi:hypothetical protein